MIKINNTIFVHGRLPSTETLLDYNYYNQIINDPIKLHEKICIFEKLIEKKSPLQNRDFGDTKIIHNLSPLEEI